VAQKRSGRHGLHRTQKRRDSDGREVRGRIGYCIGKLDPIVVPERAAGIDDIGHVPFALRGIRPHEWFRGTRDYDRWVAFVEQYGSDRVSADGTHTVANANLVIGWIKVRLKATTPSGAKTCWCLGQSSLRALEALCATTRLGRNRAPISERDQNRRKLNPMSQAGC